MKPCNRATNWPSQQAIRRFLFGGTRIIADLMELDLLPGFLCELGCDSDHGFGFGLRGGRPVAAFPVSYPVVAPSHDSGRIAVKICNPANLQTGFIFCGPQAGVNNPGT